MNSKSRRVSPRWVAAIAAGVLLLSIGGFAFVRWGLPWLRGARPRSDYPFRFCGQLRKQRGGAGG